MNLSEKAAYLDGLTDGLGLKKDEKMGALWTSLSGLLGDMARQIEELKARHDDLDDIVDNLSAELDALEEYGFDGELLDDEDDWDGDDDGEDEADVIRFNSRDGVLKPGEEPSPFVDELQELDEEEEDVDESGDESGDEPAELLPLDKLSYNGVLYDVVCPSCGEEITLDEELLQAGSTICPSCGELLEFDLSGDEDETEEPLEPIIPRLDPDKD